MPIFFDIIMAAVLLQRSNLFIVHIFKVTKNLKSAPHSLQLTTLIFNYRAEKDFLLTLSPVKLIQLLGITGGSAGASSLTL